MDDRVFELVELGYSRKDIASHLNISKSTVGRLMKKLELNSKYRENKNEIINCRKCGIEFKSNVSADRKFCSKNCSASFNNKIREFTDETKNKISITLKNKKIKNKKIRYCKVCNIVELDKRKIICGDCKMEYYKYYRPLAEFKFDISQFKDKFDLGIIEKYGWYSPSNKGNNLNGVSKDHMYSVKDGFINKIDPSIISHPANCQLLLQNLNSKKKTKSSITLNELLERIENWNNADVV